MTERSLVPVDYTTLLLCYQAKEYYSYAHLTTILLQFVAVCRIMKNALLIINELRGCLVMVYKTNLFARLNSKPMGTKLPLFTPMHNTYSVRAPLNDKLLC